MFCKSTSFSTLCMWDFFSGIVCDRYDRGKCKRKEKEWSYTGDRTKPMREAQPSKHRMQDEDKVWLPGYSDAAPSPVLLPPQLLRILRRRLYQREHERWQAEWARARKSPQPISKDLSQLSRFGSDRPILFFLFFFSRSPRCHTHACFAADFLYVS